MIENEKAIEGIKAIILDFEDDKLFGLVATVTQGLLKLSVVPTREAALEAILQYSTDAASLLKRKIISKEILFQYAYKTGLQLTMPISKEKLIEAICSHWSCSKCVKIEPTAEIVIAPSENGNNQIESNEIDLMSQKFCEWFYSMMNQNQCIGTEHFFPDATLKLKLINNNTLFVEESRDNPSDIVQVLFETKSDYNLYFNPNLLKEGTKGKMDTHGLVIVMSCGTLHINNVVSGVYEQLFALARDPHSDNNWKIKNTQLALNSKSEVTNVPQLCDSELPDT